MVGEFIFYGLDVCRAKSGGQFSNLGRKDLTVLVSCSIYNDLQIRHTSRELRMIPVRWLTRARVVVLQDIWTTLSSVCMETLTKWSRLAVLPLDGRE
jgi:hypothetical protein